MTASLAGNSWKSARSRAIAGSERRVTTALRTGSDAAQVLKSCAKTGAMRLDDWRTYAGPWGCRSIINANSYR